MSAPRLLDLYSGAGGAAMGYHRAGFEVVGVDIEPQPSYPFEFHQGDALEFLAAYGHEFAAVHASPPCQVWTAYRRKGRGVGEGYENWIPATRELLVDLGLPWVIENVESARRELRSPVKLCGSMFRRADGTPLDVQRHRMFEVGGFGLSAPGPCWHDNPYWTPRFPPATNRTNLRKTVEIGVWRIPLEVQQRAMDIDWMPLANLTEAIPPAYAQHIGLALLAAVMSGEENAA